MADTTTTALNARTAAPSTGTTLPPHGVLLDGLLVLSLLAMALVVGETSFHLVGMRRQRRERLNQVAKRSLGLQVLAERAAPGQSGVTMFKSSSHLRAPAGLAQTVMATPAAAVPAAAAIEAAVIAAVVQPAVPVQAAAEVRKPTGFETFKVLAVIDESPDVKSFRFCTVDGRPLAPFNPGQYLTIQTIPTGHDKPVIRCYSLSSAPHQSEFYQISVKAVEKGLVSAHLHRTLKPGDLVELRKPAGKFFLDPAQRLDICLIAGGIGITPCYSMAMEFLHTGRRNRIDLFYGCRTPEDVVYGQHLQELAAKHEHFRLHVVLSRAPDGAPWKGLTGRVDISLIRRVLLYNLRGRAYYLCGPSQMMTDITEALMAQGVPEDDIHYEAFGPAAPRKKDQPVV